MKIAVAGTGYVGLSLAILFSQRNEVTAVDIIPAKVDLINNRKSPIVDKEIEEYLATKELNLKATTDGDRVYKEADYVIISTPTNYDSTKNYFDTSSVESVIEQVIAVNPDAIILMQQTAKLPMRETTPTVSSVRSVSMVITTCGSKQRQNCESLRLLEQCLQGRSPRLCWSSFSTALYWVIGGTIHAAVKLLH